MLPGRLRHVLPLPCFNVGPNHAAHGSFETGHVGHQSSPSSGSNRLLTPLAVIRCHDTTTADIVRAGNRLHELYDGDGVGDRVSIRPAQLQQSRAEQDGQQRADPPHVLDGAASVQPRADAQHQHHQCGQ